MANKALDFVETFVAKNVDDEEYTIVELGVTLQPEEEIDLILNDRHAYEFADDVRRALSMPGTSLASGVQTGKITVTPAVRQRYVEI